MVWQLLLLLIALSAITSTHAGILRGFLIDRDLSEVLKCDNDELSKMKVVGSDKEYCERMHTDSNDCKSSYSISVIENFDGSISGEYIDTWGKEKDGIYARVDCFEHDEESNSIIVGGPIREYINHGVHDTTYDKMQIFEKIILHPNDPTQIVTSFTEIRPEHTNCEDMIFHRFYFTEHVASKFKQHTCD